MKCRICNSINVEPFYTIPSYPMTGGPVVTRGLGRIKSGNVSLGFCFDCGSCILLELNPDEIVYDESYTSSNAAVSLGAAIDEKMRGFINLVGELPLGRGARLLEIGCYDGSLMWQIHQQLGLNVYGCEPCPVADIAIDKYGFQIEKAYFSSSLYEKDFFDVVIFRNVLEHIAYPMDFLANVWQVLAPEGFAVLDVPDGEFRVANSVLGSIVPEHPNYFGPMTLQMVLSASGFSDIDIRPYKGGLRARGRKNGLSSGLLRLEQGRIGAVYETLKEGAAKSLRKYEMIRSLTKGLSNFCFFGANTCTLELLATNSINVKEVECAIDDDPLKWGREIVNFGIPVKPRTIVRDMGGEKTFVVCSYYSHEKLFDFLSETLRPPFRILRLYPEIKLVEVSK